MRPRPRARGRARGATSRSGGRRPRGTGGRRARRPPRTRDGRARSARIPARRARRPARRSSTAGRRPLARGDAHEGEVRAVEGLVVRPPADGALQRGDRLRVAMLEKENAPERPEVEGTTRGRPATRRHAQVRHAASSRPARGPRGGVLAEARRAGRRARAPAGRPRAASNSGAPRSATGRAVGAASPAWSCRAARATPGPAAPSGARAPATRRHRLARSILGQRGPRAPAAAAGLVTPAYRSRRLPRATRTIRRAAEPKRATRPGAAVGPIPIGWSPSREPRALPRPRRPRWAAADAGATRADCQLIVDGASSCDSRTTARRIRSVDRKARGARCAPSCRTRSSRARAVGSPTG